MDQGQVITMISRSGLNLGTSAHPRSPWLQAPGSSPPAVLPGGPDPMEAVIGAHCGSHTQCVLSGNALRVYFNTGPDNIISYLLCALHKNIKCCYLTKTTSDISPGPLLIVSTCQHRFYVFVINISSCFLHFFHLTLSLAGRSLLVCIIITFIL